MSPRAALAPIAPVLVALGLAAGPARAGIDTTPVFPTEGQQATISVTADDGAPVAGAAVEAVYRPGSKVSRSETLGTTGPDGRLTWTPDGAGIVSLQTSGEGQPALSTNLSVRFRGVPLSGLVILLGAGVILYGGVIWGFRLLATLPTQLPPDT